MRHASTFWSIMLVPLWMGIALFISAGSSPLLAAIPTDAVSLGSQSSTARSSGSAADLTSLPNTLTSSLPACLGSTIIPRCYTPQEIDRAYAIQPLLAHGITGKGRTIVIIGGTDTPLLQTDLYLFDRQFGLPDPAFHIIAPFGTPAYNVTWYAEGVLDLETAHTVAPGAALTYVTGNLIQPTLQDSLWNTLKLVQYAVEHHLGDVISQSYNAGETCVSTAYLQAVHQVDLEAEARHITLIAASGDTGAAHNICQNGVITSYGASIGEPADDPLVTAAGGTSLNADPQTGQYGGETAWNSGNGRASGGGFSVIYARPAYQDGVPGIGKMRGIPDVAWDADNETGELLESVVNGTVVFSPSSGTSTSSPAWAGITALADQYAGRDLGLLNPALYQIGRVAEKWAFHDITTGNNTVTAPPNIVVTGYAAGPGWDAVTGLGSPRASVLIPLLVRFSA